MFSDEELEEDYLDLYYADLVKRSNENVASFTKDYLEIISLIKALFDSQQKLFKLYFWMTQSDFHKNTLPKNILCIAHIKNMYTLFIAMQLSLEGIYGSSRILLRQIFEFLIIAKYSSISHNEKFIEHWEKGGDVSIGKQIFQKIEKDKLRGVYSFWKMLCEFNHATTSARQMGLNYKYVKEELGGDFAIILILLNCNYHMLTQHISDTRMKYYGDCYFSTEDKNEITKCRNLIKSSMSFISKEGKAIIKFYKSKWNLSGK